MLLNALPALNRNISTLIGLTAVIFWSTNVGLIRSVSESFGAVADEVHDIRERLAQLHQLPVILCDGLKQLPSFRILFVVSQLLSHEIRVVQAAHWELHPNKPLTAHCIE